MTKKEIKLAHDLLNKIEAAMDNVLISMERDDRILLEDYLYDNFAHRGIGFSPLEDLVKSRL
jgi:hypothetical protein